MKSKKGQYGNKFLPVYVIASKEQSSSGVECTRVIDELLKTSEKNTGLFFFDAATAEIRDVLDELRTSAFFGKTKVVVLKSADKFISANRALLEKYFESPSRISTLVLTVTVWQPNTRLAKILNKVGRLIKISGPKSWELAGRLIKYTIDAHNKRISKDAAELLIELVGDELHKLYGEIDKLALFVSDKKNITADDVESLAGRSRLFNTFEVIDTSVSGDSAGALRQLRDMFAADRSAEYTFVGAFAYHFRRMFKAKVLLAKRYAPSQIAKEVGLWRNADRFFDRLQKVSLEKISEALQQLAGTDYAIKTGRIKPQVAAEQLVLKISQGLQNK